MGWFRRVFGLKQSPGFPFDDRDREASMAMRQSRAELTRLKNELEKQRLMLEHEKEKLRLEVDIEEQRQHLEDLTGSEDEEPAEQSGSVADGMLMMLAQKILTPAAAQPPTTQQPTSTTTSMSDEQLREILETVPSKYLKLARSMSDDSLRGIIVSRLPGIDADTCNRAIRMVKG